LAWVGVMARGHSGVIGDGDDAHGVLADRAAQWVHVPDPEDEVRASAWEVAVRTSSPHYFKCSLPASVDALRPRPFPRNFLLGLDRLTSLCNPSSVNGIAGCSWGPF